MDFRKCFVCGEEAIVWDLEKIGGGWRHRRGECPSTTPTVRLRRMPTHEESAADAVDSASYAKVDPAEIQGFDRPEHGSARRFDERKSRLPWLAHRFWWLVHNAVAHPLIAVMPIRPLFRFHDWTSKKMHGL